MYNHEQNCDWIKRSKSNWSNERNVLSLTTGNCYTQEDYCGNSGLLCQSMNNNLYEYSLCGDKNGYYNDNYCGNDYTGVGSYSTTYHHQQPCQDEDWMMNCSNCTSQFNYPFSAQYNHQQPQQYRHHQQRNAYWTKNQHPQPQMQMPGTMMSNYQSNNIAGTSFNVTTAAADPLNALQNLTVSAGQSAQLMAQQNMRLNSTAFNNQIRQRSLVQGSINRPIDPLSATKSSLSQQLVQPQIPSNVVITNSNMINVNSARISTNPISMKPEICVNQNSGQQSLMLPPYPMDSCNSLMSSSQVSPMASVGKITPYSSTPSSQYQSSLPTQHSSQIIQPTNNLFPNGAPIRRTVNSQQNLRPPSIISDEEAKKVKEEVKRLKEKYFKKLTIILENPKNVSDDEIKVWTVLKTLLENPDSIQKPLSMRHISKIEQHLMKAEQHVLQKCSNQTTNIHLEKLHPNTSQIVAQSQCRTTVQKPIVNYDEKSMKKSVYPLSNSSNENVDLNNGSINSSSLDIAFDDVCRKLINTDYKVVKRVQQNLIHFFKSRQTQYRHFLPKRVFIDPDDEAAADDTKPKHPKLEPLSVDEEFGVLDKDEDDGLDLFVNKDSISLIDENRLLHTDLNFACIDMSFCDLAKELKLLEKEFQVTKIEEEHVSKDWFTHDSDWADSQFFSFLYIYKSLPSIVPPIKIRISADYEDSGSTDWNLNLELYQLPFDDFLNEVASLLTTNFTEAHHNYQWSGIPVLYIMSLYKRSILLAHENYLNRLSDES